MKIVLFLHGLTRGGAEHVTALWASGFSKRGHEVTIIVRNNYECDVCYSIPSDVQIKALKKKGNYSISRIVYRILQIRHIIKEVKPDAIITVMHPYGLYAYLATIGLKIPIFNTEHNAFERPGEAKWTRFEIFNKFYVNKLFKGVTVLTQADKDLIENRLNNVTVLPNPLAFEPVESLPVKEKKVLAMGRLDAWYIKGFDILIKSWAEVHRSHPEWRLQIAGAGSEKSQNQLRIFAEEAMVSSSVDFIGFFDKPIKAYRPASIFVLSSRCEGFGMVIVEAMSQGCACVACDYGGRQSEIIRSESEGLVCETENVGQLSSCICKLIEDEQVRKKIQESSIRRSKDYSLDVIMDKWDGILSKIK